MKNALKLRRFVAAFLLLLVVGVSIAVGSEFWQRTPEPTSQETSASSAAVALESLEVKGRAPKTGYSREQFGGDWGKVQGCDMRNVILARDLENEVVNERCQVVSGMLNDPYTGEVIEFQRGAGTSDDIQIDHVVALSDAWQKGAQQLAYEKRVEFANDPLELLAVNGAANQQKSDGDAATWLTPQKAFRCQYVARQIAVKKKYSLWVTEAEKEAMKRVLSSCPGQALP